MRSEGLAWKRCAAPMSASSLVYVVDNEYSIAWSIAAVLRISGFSVEAFTNPLETMKAARSLTPNLLISDVMMPELLDFISHVNSKSFVRIVRFC